MRWFIRAVSFIAFVSAMMAQVPGTGSIELGGFVGATYGFGSYGGMGGGNFSYAVNKYFLPYAEFSYFPHLEREVKGTTNAGTPYKAPYELAATDFHGGIHFRVPIRESRIVPYGVFGVGRLGYSSGTVNISFTDTTTGKLVALPPLTSPGGGRAAVNFGGGLRFYAHPRFGFRVEAKVYKPTGDVSLGYSNPFLKVEGGFFLQLR